VFPRIPSSTMLSAFVVLALALPSHADDANRVRSAVQDRTDTSKPDDVPMTGVVVLQPTRGQEVRGTLRLVQQSSGLRIIGRIEGLTPGKHGFHVHEFGDLSDPEGKSAGGHFNPDNRKHGGPDDAERHAGDLGNIEADGQGVAMVDVQGRGLKLHFVLGRAVVVHSKADDLKSQPSGDAGDRVAVGVIGIAQQEAGTTEKAAPTSKSPTAEPRPR
jgi:superoxide dismutase, Cu-Zn family